MNLDLLCKCSHRSSVHIHGPGREACKRSCNCGEFRLAVRPERGDETAATGNEPPRCICMRFSDTGGFRIADLCCPVHGAGGTEPGDGYWDDAGGAA